MLTVVGGQVCSAPPKGDAKRGSREDHAHGVTTPSHTVDILALPRRRRGHPVRLVEPLEGADDGLANTQPRLPAEGSDSGRVEIDQWTVPYPSSRATGVLDGRIHCEPSGDDADGFVDRHGLARTQIVHMRAGAIGVMLRGSEHR